MPASSQAIVKPDCPTNCSEWSACTLQYANYYERSRNCWTYIATTNNCEYSLITEQCTPIQTCAEGYVGDATCRSDISPTTSENGEDIYKLYRYSNCSSTYRRIQQCSSSQICSGGACTAIVPTPQPTSNLNIWVGVIGIVMLLVAIALLIRSKRNIKKQ